MNPERYERLIVLVRFCFPPQEEMEVNLGVGDAFPVFVMVEVLSCLELRAGALLLKGSGRAFPLNLCCRELSPWALWKSCTLEPFGRTLSINCVLERLTSSTVAELSSSGCAVELHTAGELCRGFWSVKREVRAVCQPASCRILRQRRLTRWRRAWTSGSPPPPPPPAESEYDLITVQSYCYLLQR